jgi:hypothetical protein
MAFGWTTTAFTPWWLARIEANGKAPIGLYADLTLRLTPHAGVLGDWDQTRLD